MTHQHRTQLRQLLGLSEDIEIAFTPSGTDVELLALALVAGQRDRRIINLVVGPTEVGTGTPKAAAGLHYDSLVPSGAEVTVGTPVSTELANAVAVRTIDLRDHNGKMLEEIEIDALVTEMVADAVGTNAHVLVHLVAHSKTGVHAPSLSCVDRIARHLGDDVTIVIDAAQGRVSRRGLQDVLNRGYLVMFTGSKFYGGPPFSGALLVPKNLRPERTGITRLPAEFADYFTPAELPETWSDIVQDLEDRVNYGALLRWSAALAEMQAYYDVRAEDRLAILRVFEEAVPKVLSESDHIQLMPVFPPIRDDLETRLLESKTTVFAFRIQGREQFLDRDSLKQLHRELNRDEPDPAWGEPSEALRQAFHIGQPVPFHDGTAALRIALGGATIVKIATDQSLGDSLEARIQWLVLQVKRLKTKISRIVEARLARIDEGDTTHPRSSR